MKKILTYILCLLVLQATAQSFDSLKRSKGKTELFAAVEKTLSGQMNVSECKNIIAKSSTLTEPFDGKTPIYLILDYLATHPKNDCSTAEQLIDAFIAHKAFDVNMRYRNNLPPLAYLIRKNFDYLGEQFDAKYISDTVLKKLIEAGAEVNTFNSDGNTLMSFARETNNEYLYSYFIQKGIDLRHQNDKGEDDTYYLIADGKLKSLIQAKERGILKLDINSLKNEPKDFASNKELYDFIAEHCALQANKYEDLVLFRKRFSDKKSLVATKYETMARNEANAATDFFQIQKCIERFPDMSKITDSRVLDIYRQDCKLIDNLYVKLCISVTPVNLFADLPYDDKVEYFLKAYDEHNYDPNNFVPKARDLQNAHDISIALKENIYRDYFDGYDYYKGLVSIIDNILRKGISASEQSCSDTLREFFDKSNAELRSKKSVFNSIVDDQYNRYLAYKEARKARIDAAYRQQRAEKEDWDKKLSSDNAGYYVLQKVQDYGEWSKGRFLDTDDDFQDNRTVTFTDGIKVSVSWEHREAKGINRYGFDNGFLSGWVWYNNLNDAIIGAYMHAYDGSTWYDGKIKD